ncbi:uncharacterized protein LOC117334725 [Pecten maximus]|uniref:uncharacterized protein LOC117334725 n=1 Tax=Pecten maximus TaxID=6579 RepID=UPI0014586A4B|nr:uncharacterized protein LOC117334725 [Pecten maximus]
MNHGIPPDLQDMTLPKILDELVVMARPTQQDQRLENYCRYINMAMSDYGQEHCMVVGSTKEGTRLRTKQEQGDWDFLLMGDLTVPVESLKYRKDLPCFVHINGSFIKQIDRKDLIDGEFLPATMVKKLNPVFFGRLKGIFDLFYRPQAFKEGGVSRVTMDTDIKPGANTTDFIDWQSDILIPKTNPRSVPDSGLRKKYTERVKRSEVFQDSSNGVVHIMETIAKSLQYHKTLVNSDSFFHRTFGPLLDALAGNQNFGSVGKKREDDKLLTNVSNADDADVRGNSPEDQDKRYEKTTEVKYVIRGNSNCLPVRQLPAKPVRATYTARSMKDFIPALRLSGPPKYINDWIRRTRYWPKRQTVDAITKSQFLVVAKPAIKDEHPELDFCLSCNLAEIMLAKEMPPGHMKCLLMIKAFQRSILEEYSQVLTTFHWKTALYWMLESTDPSTYSEKSDDILDVLRNLLDYMRDRLHEGRLLHYFFPSNLFAGLERDVCVEIVKKLEEVYMKPVWNLQVFLVKVNEKGVKVIDVPLDKMMEMKKKIEDEKKRSYVDATLDVFEGIGRSHSENNERSAARQNFPNLVLQIAKSIILDERASIEKENKTSTAEQGTATEENVLSGLADVLLNKETGTENRTRAVEKLVQDIRSFLLADD